MTYIVRTIANVTCFIFFSFFFGHALSSDLTGEMGAADSGENFFCTGFIRRDPTEISRCSQQYFRIVARLPFVLLLQYFIIIRALFSPRHRYMKLGKKI